MYRRRPGLILAFHGCDASVVEDATSGRLQFKPSENAYDWLGKGMYFWEYSPSRAMEFAKEKQKREPSKISTPAVLGAVIDMGNCLDLLEYENLKLVKIAHTVLEKSLESEGKTKPINKPIDDSGYLFLRELDCAVFDTLHQVMKNQHQSEFDSIRGVFWEGAVLYDGSGLREKDHIQLCIRNPNCIKGYFKPRDIDSIYPNV